MLESNFVGFIASDGFAVILYIDPTAGGVLLQIAFGGITGILVIMKLFWSRLVAFLPRRNKKHRNTPGSESKVGN